VRGAHTQVVRVVSGGRVLGVCITRAFHLRAVCPEGAGRSAVARSATAVKRDDFLNTRARQVQTLVLPRLSRPRRRSAPPAPTPHAIAAVLPSSEFRPSTRCVAIATVLPRSGARSAPFVPSGAHAPRRSTTVLALSTSWRAKRVEQKTARRQNAAFHLRASVSEGDGCSPPRGARGRLNVMASLNVALVRCK
jgi:hypothetical protein